MIDVNCLVVLPTTDDYNAGPFEFYGERFLVERF